MTLDLFGGEDGPFVRIDDIVAKVGITRATFYNHFSDMKELRDSLSFEVTHDFLAAVTYTVSEMPDARDRSAIAVRFYLHRARRDRRWGWSMINISASGLIFGAETYRQAEQTVREGLKAGVFQIPSSMLGRDVLLGSCLAALGSITREDVPENYPETVAGYILVALGVPYDQARAIAHQPMPDLVMPDGKEYGGRDSQGLCLA